MSALDFMLLIAGVVIGGLVFAGVVLLVGFFALCAAFKEDESDG